MSDMLDMSFSSAVSEIFEECEEALLTDEPVCPAFTYSEEEGEQKEEEGEEGEEEEEEEEGIRGGGAEGGGWRGGGGGGGGGYKGRLQVSQQMYSW